MKPTRLLSILSREPADVYHAKGKSLLTSHRLAEFHRCPLLYRRKQLGLVHEPYSAAFLIGRAAHTLILDGRAVFEREYAVGHCLPARTRSGETPAASNAFGHEPKILEPAWYSAVSSRLLPRLRGNPSLSRWRMASMMRFRVHLVMRSLARLR
jgi:hypothetical protein